MSEKDPVNTLGVTFLARLYESSGRAIAPPQELASVLAVVLTKMSKFNVKVFRTSCFLNPLMDLVYIWYNYRCWSKILLSPIHILAHDLKVKVMDLEILC